MAREIASPFPEPRPRLTPTEAETLRAVFLSADWSRAGDDWPLPPLEILEHEWAQVHQTAHAVAVSSGTAALRLTLEALALHPGDEVLVPAYGCPAVDVAVLSAGLTPIHVDIDPATWCMSPSAAAAAVTGRTGALVAVHFAGQPARLEALVRVARRSGIALVEDACLAPGACYGDRPVGTWSRAAVFSLGVRKPVSAGEGGLVVTDDPALAAAVRRQRSLGADPETGEIERPGGNYRLTSLQAAVVLPQLARLEAGLERRANAASQLTSELEDCPWLRPLERDSAVSRHGWAQFWLRCDESELSVPRERIAQAVQALGIPLFPGWTRPNYCLAMYTPARAAIWLRDRASDREADHYERTHCPHAERAAFTEALILDFPILDAEPEVVRRATEALVRVSRK